MVTTVTVTVFESQIPPYSVIQEQYSKSNKITFGVFKFLFGVIEITFRETISIYNIGCQST